MIRPLVFVTLIASLAVPSFADDGNYLRLARLSYIEGHVSYQHRSDVDWSAASINFPLEPGDRIYTGQDGRTEIQFDDGSVFRLAENTDFEILSLKENLVQARMLVGLATLTVAGSVDYEMNTPAAAFNTIIGGVYRFSVAENGDSDAIVRKGELEAANNQFSQRIGSGELLHIRSGGDGNPILSRYDGRDQWDEWTDRRTADMKAYASRNYLPETVSIGASDLDRYGRWVRVDSYGTVWAPYAVDASWSPYSVGRWCYRPFYGWTWISYEPWGWLPYHYGRWYRSVSYGWCWIPGPSFAFSFWSPGLVAFYNGPSWVSWCPLGPGDFYSVNNYFFNHRLQDPYLTRLHALHTRAPGDLFNRSARGAFRTVDLDHFRNGIFPDRGIATRQGYVEQPWRQGSLVRDRLNVRPTSVSYRPAPDRPAVRPTANSSLPVVVRSNPSVRPEGRERFAPITNPRIPPAPSREGRDRSEPAATDAGSRIRTNDTAVPAPRRESGGQGNPSGSGLYQTEGRYMNTPPASGRNDGNRGNSASAPRPDARPSNDSTNGSGAGSRIIAVPRRERTDQDNQNPSGNGLYQQGGRYMNTPRPAGARENPGAGIGSGPVARPDSTPGAPRGRDERPPAQAPQAPQAQPRIAVPRSAEPQQTRNPEPRSNTGTIRLSPGAGSAAPSAEPAPRVRSTPSASPASGHSGGASRGGSSGEAPPANRNNRR